MGNSGKKTSSLLQINISEEEQKDLKKILLPFKFCGLVNTDREIIYFCMFRHFSHYLLVLKLTNGF
jgi:hypothetical protein